MVNLPANRLLFTLALLCTTDLIQQCKAQNVTVQLPTFEQFGVSTTVVVPDRGSLFLGGVNGSSRGGSRFGPGLPGLGNRATGRAIDAGGMSISATIIDHSEIDRALLAEAARRRGDKFDIHGRPVADAPRLSPAVTRQVSPPRERDLRPARPTRRYVRSERSGSRAESHLAETYLQRAERAEAKGEPYQAKIFYQRVLKHGNSTQRGYAEVRLAQLQDRTKY